MQEINLEINKYALDEEAKIQPELVRKYGKMLSAAKDTTLRMKRLLAIAESEGIEKIRADPESFGVSEGAKGSVSDATAAKAVQKTKIYEKAFNAYLEAKRYEEDVGHILDAIKDRGYMIKALVELWLNKYYSEITVYERKRTSVKDELTTGSNKRLKLNQDY